MNSASTTGAAVVHGFPRACKRWLHTCTVTPNGQPAAFLKNSRGAEGNQASAGGVHLKGEKPEAVRGDRSSEKRDAFLRVGDLEAKLPCAVRSVRFRRFRTDTEGPCKPLCHAVTHLDGVAGHHVGETLVLLEAECVHPAGHGSQEVRQRCPTDGRCCVFITCAATVGRVRLVARHCSRDSPGRRRGHLK